MSTVIRAEISEKKKYHVNKERYYELKHFCLQYPYWKKLYSETQSGFFPGGIILKNIDAGATPDFTADLAIERMEILDKIQLVEECARLTDPDLAIYIFKAVTEGRSFAYLSGVMNIPCGKDMFYDRYRKFFWLLDKKRT